MKARVSNLIKTEAEWLKLDFKPYPGELIVYAPDNVNDYTRIKIGDGIHGLHELPFAIEHTAALLLEEHQHKEIIDAGCITDYFN